MRVGSLTFALVVTRSGTLNGLPASSTSYFHNDHLGSIAAITNEAGAVVERLAFDPWGKRRFVNPQPGKADALDAIVGVRTDRGYTGHEHLDGSGRSWQLRWPTSQGFPLATPTSQPAWASMRRLPMVRLLVR